MPSPFATNSSLFRLIRAAQAAPSIHNSQPWSFWIRSDDRLELRADHKRRLPVTDPRARELTISCGAALFNLRMAIRAAGHQPVIWLAPDEKNDPNLLASVEIAPSSRRATVGEQALYDAIPHRHTSREPFTGPRVPLNIVAELEDAARQERAVLRLLHRRESHAMLRAALRADRQLSADASYVHELMQWTGSDLSGYGVPTAAFGPLPRKPLPGRAPPPTRDLGLAWRVERRVERFEAHPVLLVLATENDRLVDWLRAGQALERVLLMATRRGLATSLLSQQFEISDRHLEPVLRHQPQVRYGQIVVRLGYGAPTTGTPRAAYPDVIDCRSHPPLPIRPPSGSPAAQIS